METSPHSSPLSSHCPTLCIMAQSTHNGSLTSQWSPLLPKLSSSLWSLLLTEVSLFTMGSPPPNCPLSSLFPLSSQWFPFPLFTMVPFFHNDLFSVVPSPNNCLFSSNGSLSSLWLPLFSTSTSPHNGTLSSQWLPLHKMELSPHKVSVYSQCPF
jgi:hypothetical protein